MKDLNAVNSTYASTGDVVASLENDVTTMWIVKFKGPQGTPFAGGTFSVRFNCENYPFKSPKISFTTKIYHPGVSQDKGEICMKALEDSWVPTMGCQHCIQHILTLLQTPSADQAQDTSIAQVFTSNHAQWAATAAEWTAQHAQA